MKVQLRFHLPRHQRPGLFMVFLLLISMAIFLVSWTVDPAAHAVPQAPEANPMREFYMSQVPLAANAALDACTAGYHFASVWEVADVSKLKYNTDLGYTTADSGAGPPVAPAWARAASASADVAQGVGANCDLWESNATDEFGSVMSLTNQWTAESAALNYWNVAASACSTRTRVWCIEDEFPQFGELFLPTIQNAFTAGQ